MKKYIQQKEEETFKIFESTQTFEDIAKDHHLSHMHPQSAKFTKMKAPVKLIFVNSKHNKLKDSKEKQTQ